MTEIEKKALALIRECKNNDYKALCRAIEQHEAFRQEVSDAVERAIEDCGHDGLRKGYIHGRFSRFIIVKPKPDPLVEALRETLTRRHIVPSDDAMTDEAAWLREALAKRGLQVTEIER